jgi:hypothetical protein
LDPLHRRRDLWKAISSPVSSLKDKLHLAPLFYTVVTKSIDELFAMEETDILSSAYETIDFRRHSLNRSLPLFRRDLFGAA